MSQEYAVLTREVIKGRAREPAWEQATRTVLGAVLCIPLLSLSELILDNEFWAAKERFF